MFKKLNFLTIHFSNSTIVRRYERGFFKGKPVRIFLVFLLFMPKFPLMSRGEPPGSGVRAIIFCDKTAVPSQYWEVKVGVKKSVFPNTVNVKL